MVELTLLLEFGPVVLIVPLAVPSAAPLPAPAEELLLTESVALTLLPLEAAPLVAEPPVVLPLTLAEPVDAPWPLLAVAVTSLSLCCLWLLFVTALTLLVELGPVLDVTGVGGNDSCHEAQAQDGSCCSTVKLFFHIYPPLGSNSCTGLITRCRKATRIACRHRTANLTAMCKCTD